MKFLNKKTGGLLNTASNVWKFLQEQGGIELRNYDQGLSFKLFKTLEETAPDTGAGDLDSLLASGAITVEDFLVAFFRATQPFSDMMSDLLRMFEKAGIKHGKQNMDVRFHFDKKSKPLDFNLEHFRHWQEVWQRVAESFLVSLWTDEALWNINRAVYQPETRINDPQMRAWLEEYQGTDIRPPSLSAREPPAPKSGVAELDAAFERLWDLWLTVVRKSRRHGPEREELARRWRENNNCASSVSSNERAPERGESDPRYPSEKYRALWPLNLLGGLDSDHWAASVAQGSYAKAEAIQRLPEPQRSAEAKTVHEKLTAVFADLGTAKVTGESLRRTLLDFLSLPVWKQRHELYSAWIMTQILAALHEDMTEIHAVNNRLLFEFRPTHLATMASRQPHLHLMAEVRSPLTNPLGLGRKGSIQPDYSLVPSPITSPECSLLEVECKQYLKAARKKFAHALSDYARGRPRAQIVLVNYGPANDSILESVEPDVRSRTRILGEMLPRSEPAQSTFAQWVREAIPASLTVRPVRASSARLPRPLGMAAEIHLQWGSTPKDLDLFLLIKAGHLAEKISFSAKGNISIAPWAQLNHDDTSGQGSETIQIAKWLDGIYRCMVFNYSDDAPLAGSGAMLTIALEEQQLQFVCPSQGAGRWWEVISYDPKAGKLEILDRITDAVSD